MNDQYPIARHFAYLCFALASCAHTDEPGFTAHGVEFKCFRDIPATQLQRTKESAELAAKVLASPEFKHRALSALADSSTHFYSIGLPSMSTWTADEKVQRMTSQKGPLSVAAKYSPWPWSRTNAWDGLDVPADPCNRVVPMNRWHLGKRENYLWAGTIVHEMAHVVGFDHETQERVGNECTIPHVMGDIAEWTAWEFMHPGAGYVTWQVVCPSVAAVCRSDGHCNVDPTLGPPPPSAER